MLNKLFKSILEQDLAPIVVCDINDIIVYMNPSAIERYHKDLTGSSIKDCHPPKANEMIEIIAWMNIFLKALNKTFGDRVWFVGLQGSYGRGEATEKSDIDIVVILDVLYASDIETYNTMLGTLSHRGVICGFLSGKNEILNWEPFDLFQI